MISPHIDRSEAMRLINEIGMADVWMAITFSTKDNEIKLHADHGKEIAYLLLSSYIMKDKEFLNFLFNRLNDEI
jgi:hypothetical protein